MNKITTLTSAVLMASFSTIAFSSNPPEVPGGEHGPYGYGPQSPLVANTDLSDAERAAYALFEGVMQIAEAKIHATSCTSAASTSSIFVFADGSQGNRPQNFIDVTSLGGSVYLDANLKAKEQFRGQIVKVKQQGLYGILAGTAIFNYKGKVIYNEPNNMMVGKASVDVLGINGYPDSYQSTVIKDFNRGSLDSKDTDYYTIFDWGLQSLHKLGYPVNKYWQRSKSRRDNGSIGRTVFVKDRLVGSSKCRITIDTMGSNNEDFFSQNGTLVIERVAPKTDVPAFHEYPFYY